jgi:hypothetical protein
MFRWGVDLFVVRALARSRWLLLQDTKPPGRHYSRSQQVPRIAQLVAVFMSLADQLAMAQRQEEMRFSAPVQAQMVEK